MGDPYLRIVNVGSYSSFQQGRIANASHLSLGYKLKDKSTPNSLVPGKVFEQAVAKAGVSNHNKVVVYGTTSSKIATRAWWVFKRYGMDVAVLDGGIKQWKKHGFAVEYDRQPRQVEAGVFVRKNVDSVVVTMAEVEAAVADNTSHIIDTRTPNEYTGVLKKNARGGHIPGAINIPHTSFLHLASGTFLLDANLVEVARNAGLPDPVNAKTVITYCQSGVRATLVALALEKIGYDVAVYDGSMVEWQNEDSTPLVSDADT